MLEEKIKHNEWEKGERNEEMKESDKRQTRGKESGQGERRREMGRKMRNK